MILFYNTSTILDFYNKVEAYFNTYRHEKKDLTITYKNLEYIVSTTIQMNEFSKLHYKIIKDAEGLKT